MYYQIFLAFERYTPCFNKQCQALEEECGERCGSLDEAKEEWWSQMTDNETAITEREIDLIPPPPPPAHRRKREKSEVILTDTTVASPYRTTTDGPEFHYTDGPELEGPDQEALRGGFSDTCK